ncbi:peptide chain release factor N(5)-glutamine methyltransferase, partial [Cribrihabitans sp. XS_ASV171]
MNAVQTAAQAMVVATARLRAAGVPDPARDARLLLAHAARIEASRVTLIAPEALSPEISERYEQLIALRAIRVPVSHLVGERAFYGRRFKVSGDVLDPRPETETLIEAALARPYGRVLDLGTGSGCILVTLLAERPDATGMGTDLSEAACLQASANAVLHRVQERAEIVRADWFAGVTGQFDLIVSNPPYIAQAEMEGLAPEVREHEPEMALTDGRDGLSAYRAIAGRAVEFLRPGGR